MSTTNLTEQVSIRLSPLQRRHLRTLANNVAMMRGLPAPTESDMVRMLIDRDLLETLRFERSVQEQAIGLGCPA